MTTKQVICCECGHQLIKFYNLFSDLPEFYGHSGTTDCKDFVRFDNAIKKYQQYLLVQDLSIAEQKLLEAKQRVIEIKKQITNHNKPRKKETNE